jgi:transposase
VPESRQVYQRLHLDRAKSKLKRYSPKFRERAVRMLLDQQKEYNSQWAAMRSITEKVGCTAETLCKWVRQTEINQGDRKGPTSTELERLKALEWEYRELKQANEILRKAAAFSPRRSSAAE